jgi:hypothetical protein
MKPDMLVATEDDKFKEQKEKLCKEAGARFIVLPKDGLDEPILSSDQLQELLKVPLRVDFAGAWLDVPFFSIKGAYIVNCAISPRVSPTDWPYRKQGNLGESAAWNYLQGRDAVEGDLKLGVGWQNPAVIKETGLCVWKSGATPVLALKDSGKMLAGKMALMWTGEGKNVEEIVGKLRDYKAIRHAADLAKEAVLKQNIYKMAHAVNLTHDLQVSEGMLPLPMLENCLGRKYCGEGFGGYALYLFEDTEQRDKASKFVPLTPVEPYYK